MRTVSPVFPGEMLAKEFFKSLGLAKSSRDISRKSKMHGTFTSAAEVTHVSKHGFWLLFNGEELLVPFTEFPWFKKATIEQLSTVEWPSANHLYWPQLDVDLSVESIRNPGAFLLLAKAKS